MHGFEHLRPHERAPRHNTLQTDHLSQIRCPQISWAYIVVAERATKPYVITFALDLVFLGVVHLLDDGDERFVERGEEVDRVAEDTISKIALVVAQVVDVDDEARAVHLEHAQDVVFVVVERGLRREEFFEDTRTVAHEIILGNRLIEERHGGKVGES